MVYWDTASRDGVDVEDVDVELWLRMGLGHYNIQTAQGLYRE